MIRKLGDLQSRPEKTNEGNQYGNNQTGLNRNYQPHNSNNNNNNSAMPSRGTSTARQGSQVPVIERTPKPEPPCFNCSIADSQPNYDETL